MSSITKLHRPTSSEQTIKADRYFLRDEFDFLTTPEKSIALDILEKYPPKPNKADWNRFRTAMRILCRDTRGSMINPHGKTCWFNALVQGVFKRPNFIEMLKADSEGLDPAVREMRKELLQIIEDSDAPIPEDINERKVLNQRLNDRTESFVKGLTQRYGYDYYEQQDSFDALTRMLNDLGFNVRGGSLDPTFRTKRFTSQTHLTVGTCLYNSNSNEFKPPRFDQQGYLPLTLRTSSIQGNLAEFTMNFEALNESEWVEFKGRKEPTLRACYLVDRSDPPPTLIISLNRFRTMRNRSGRFITLKDNSTVVLNFMLSVPFFNDLGSRVTSVAQYALTNVLTHIGETVHSGHYRAFKIDQPSQITLFDDDRVTRCQGSNDLHQAENLIHKNGYQAIYSLWGIRSPTEGEFLTRDQSMKLFLEKN